MFSPAFADTLYTRLEKFLPWEWEPLNRRRPVKLSDSQRSLRAFPIVVGNYSLLAPNLRPAIFLRSSAPYRRFLRSDTSARKFAAFAAPPRKRLSLPGTGCTAGPRRVELTESRCSRYQDQSLERPAAINLPRQCRIAPPQPVRAAARHWCHWAGERQSTLRNFHFVGRDCSPRPGAGSTAPAKILSDPNSPASRGTLLSTCIASARPEGDVGNRCSSAGETTRGGTKARARTCTSLFGL